MNRNVFFCVSTSCFVSSRTTVVAVAAFLDAFQKVADLATNSRGKMGTRCSPYGDQSPGSRHTVRRIVLKESSEQSQVQLLVIVVKMSVRVLVVFLTVSISYLFSSLTFIIVALWGL